MFRQFRDLFWLPPRAHGEIIHDRSVSFLELFYDLVYVVLVATAADTLAEDISWQSFGEFAAIFGLIWLAWVNGTQYYELHGREDGRTRVYVFLQMLLITLLATFTAGAAGVSGRSFAVVYALYTALLTWLWYTVRRRDTEEYMPITSRYLTMMIVSIVVVVISVFLPSQPRVLVWGGLVLAWMVGGLWLSYAPNLEFGVAVTDSMVERYGLFVIIVLGEVVVGVVRGLSGVEQTFRTVATAMLGLMIGFAYWWTYFDYVGRRLPHDVPPIRTRWLYAHLPVTLSIAAAGAAMVSLVVHAEDLRTPAPTAWLLTGSVTLGLMAMLIQMGTLRDFTRLPTVYRPVSAAMVAAAPSSLLLGLWGPAPWLLALLVVVLLGVVWFYAISRTFSLADPRMAFPGAE